MSNETQEYQLQSGINTRARAKKVNNTINVNEDSAITQISKSHRKRKRHWTMTVDELTANENGSLKSKPIRKVARLSDTLPKDDKSNTEKELERISTPTFTEAIAIKTPKKSPIKKLNTKIGSHLPKLSVTSRTSNGTPRRSTKTPKKSPKNLSSPKTCSTTPSKTPRKLKLTVEPPKITAECVTPEEPNLQVESTVQEMKEDTSLSPSTKKLSQKKSPMNLKHSIRKFSKSPKIILRSPKSKTKSDPKPGKRKKTLTKQTSPSMEKSGSEDTNKMESSSPTRLHEQESPQIKSSIVNIKNNQVSSLKQLVVVLHRLPSMNGDLVESPVTNASSTPSTKSKRIDSSVLSSGPNEGFLKKSVKNLEISQIETDEKHPLRPTMSSTPRDGKQMNSIKSNQQRLRSFNLTIENESAPSFCDIDYTNGIEAPKDLHASKDATIVLENEEAETKNGTYELLEPKTPDLRERLRKKTSSPKIEQKVQLSEKPKKIHRVRFANSTPLNDSVSFVAKDTMLCTPYSVVKPISNIDNSEKTDLSKNILKSTPASNRKRTSSIGFSSASRGASSFIETKRAKKIPDFASIHKKLFAKSESLLDAKKRLEDRHKSLTTIKMDLAKTKITPKSNSRLADEATKGPYNRFGFKVRKTEATDCILKKSNVVSRNTKKAENRAILKGVRTNRRFELQMKLRNIDM